MEYKKLAEELVKKCLNLGADAAEVYIQTGRNLSIEVRNGEVETIEEAGSKGIGFRIFKKGSMAFAHCNDFSPAAMEEAMAAAIQYAGSTTADKNNVLPDDDGITDVGPLFDPRIATVPMEKKIAMARELEKLAMRDKRISKSAGAAYSEGESEVYLANSHGLAKMQKGSSCVLGVSVVAEKGEQKSSGGNYCARRFFSDLKQLDEIAAKAARDAYEMLDPGSVKTQRAAVIFDPDVARSLLGGILGAVNGERVLQGASFLADQLGNKVFSEKLTMVDDGTQPKGLSTSPFDGEGVPTQKRVVIDRGVVKSYMYNTIVAKRAGVKSTGNASRRGFRSLPGIGSHRFFIANGDTPPGDIIASTKKGLWLKGVTGYGINPVNGNFSGGASGFWIENGKVLFPVKGLTIAGSAKEMLNQIDLLGNDLDPIDNSAPTIRISGMQIGGE